MRNKESLLSADEKKLLSWGSNQFHDYLIGLDPGKKTGVCLYDKSKKIVVKLCTLDFWQVFDLITEVAFILRGIDYQGKIAFNIENSALNKPTFAKPEDGKELTRQKISRNVGSNQRESVLLIEGIRRLGYEVKEVRPTKKAAFKGKITVELFKAMTGWKGSSSQHARDAAMLVI